MKTKILIVEDEILIADRIERYLLRESDNYEVVGIAVSVRTAKAIIKENQPDLVLLDIRLDDEEEGIDLAHWIISNELDILHIYLTSQFDKFYLERAKETFPAGYLTKPIQTNTLLASIAVALNNRSLQRGPEEEQTLYLRGASKQQAVKPSEIHYLESDHVYVIYHFSESKIIVRETLQAALQRLPQEMFVQVHRSYAINLKHVVSFTRLSIKIAGQDIPVSRSKRAELSARIGG